MLGRLETIVLDVGFGAYDGSLSANTVGEDKNIRKQTHEDFLKRSNKKFQIHLNRHGALVHLGFAASPRELLLLSLIAIVTRSTEIIVQNTSFVRLLCSFHHSISSA